MNRLRHNPEKGLSGGESDKDSKSSEKSKGKSEKKSSDPKAPENRRASFFAKEKAEQQTDEKKSGILDKKEDIEQVNPKENEANNPKDEYVENENDVIRQLAEQEVKDANGVENGEDENSQELNESESRDVAAQVAQARQEDIADNLTRVEPESPDEAEELAAAAYLSSVERHLGEGEDFTPDLLDQAMQETAEDLNYDSTEIEEPIIEQQESNDAEKENAPTEALEQPIEQSEEPVPEDVEDDESNPRQNNQQVPNQNQNQNTQNTQQPPPTPSNPNVPSPPQPNPWNPNGPPPPPPTPGNPNGPPPPPQPGNPNFYSFYGQQPPNQTNYNLVSDPNDYYARRAYRRRRTKHLLIGGIVGYVIGRRGGRKRTEKKLLPKINKLERDVSKLHDAVVQREEQIRLLARRHAERDRLELIEKQQASRVVQAEKPDPQKLEVTVTNTDKLTSVAAVTITNQDRIKVFVKRQKERQKAAEKQRTTERMHVEGSISKMAETHLKGLGMFVERRRMDGTEQTRKRFEVMNDNELRFQAKDIVVDGVSVIAAHESGRIDSATLLEVTKRYWRKGTGSYETVFRNNLKPDEKVLSKHRERLEVAHSEKQVPEEAREKAAGEYAKQLAEDFYNRDPSTFTTDEEKQAYFQRFTEESDQASDFGRLLKKAQKGTIIKRRTGWIALLVVLVVAAVLWFIIQSSSNSSVPSSSGILWCDDYQTVTPSNSVPIECDIAE